jgi:hypothetical protein
MNTRPQSNRMAGRHRRTQVRLVPDVLPSRSVLVDTLVLLKGGVGIHGCACMCDAHGAQAELYVLYNARITPSRPEDTMLKSTGPSHGKSTQMHVGDQQPRNGPSKLAIAEQAREAMSTGKVKQAGDCKTQKYRCGAQGELDALHRALHLQYEALQTGDNRVSTGSEASAVTDKQTASRCSDLC